VANLVNLKTLQISGQSNLTGRIPKQLASCTKLVLLHLDDNNFQGEVSQRARK